MPTSEHADDQRVQAGIGQEAVAELLGLAVEDDGEQDGEDEEQASCATGRPAGA